MSAVRHALVEDRQWEMDGLTRVETNKLADSEPSGNAGNLRTITAAIFGGYNLDLRGLRIASAKKKQKVNTFNGSNSLGPTNTSQR